MTYSNEGLEMTKFFEGCRLTAYQDEAGVWTIGWGDTGDVFAGKTITQSVADLLLSIRIGGFLKPVADMVTVPLQQCQFDALVDFVYNLGPGALRGSKLLRKLNALDYQGAAAEFPKWNKVRVNGVLQVSPGLTRRRLAEQAMFEGRDWHEL